MFSSRPKGEQVWEIITNTDCNLRCDYCFATNKSQLILKKENIKDIFNFIKNYKYKLKDAIIKVYGGESLIYPELVLEIMEETLKLKQENHYQEIRFVLITNGTIYNEDFIEKLCQLKLFMPYSSVGITIDGNKECHDSHRKTVSGKESFDLVIKNLNLYLDFISKKNYINNGANIIGLQYVLTPEIINNFEKTKDLILKCENINLNLSELVMNDESYNDLDLKKTEEVLKELYKIKKGKTGNAYRINSNDKIFDDYKVNKIRSKSCSIGFYYHSFLPTGEIYPCSNFFHNGFTNYVLGNFITKEYDEKKAKLINDMKRSNECEGCETKGNCMGYCLANNLLYRKSTNKLNKKVCEFNKIYSKVHQEYFKK